VSMKKRVTIASKIFSSSCCWNAVVKSPYTRLTDNGLIETSGNKISRRSSAVLGWCDHRSMNGWMVAKTGVVEVEEVR
jgi:hypothetical protein